MSGAHLADENLTGSFCAFGYVRADGTIANQGGDWSVVRVSAGLYRVTYGTPLTALMAPILGSAEAYATRDSVTIRYDNVTVNGFDVHTTEGDNGTAANAPRDRDWSFAVPCGEPVGVVNAERVEVDRTRYATAFLNQTDIHPSAGGVAVQTIPADFSSDILDPSWTRAANVISYSGQADAIEGRFNVRAEDAGASNYWANPMLRVTETVSGRVFWDRSLAMQDNTAYDGTVVFSGGFVHRDPPANPVYMFEWFSEENRTATLIPDTDASLTLKAVEKVTVYAP